LGSITENQERDEDSEVHTRVDGERGGEIGEYGVEVANGAPKEANQNRDCRNSSTALGAGTTVAEGSYWEGAELSILKRHASASISMLSLI